MTVASTTTEAVPTSKLLSNSSGRVDEPPNSAKDESQANSQFPASDPGSYVRCCSGTKCTFMYGPISFGSLF